MASLREWGLTLGKVTGRPVARMHKDSDPDIRRLKEAAAAADCAAPR